MFSIRQKLFRMLFNFYWFCLSYSGLVPYVKWIIIGFLIMARSFTIQPSPALYYLSLPNLGMITSFKRTLLNIFSLARLGNSFLWLGSMAFPTELSMFFLSSPLTSLSGGLKARIVLFIALVPARCMATKVTQYILWLHMWRRGGSENKLV